MAAHLFPEGKETGAREGEGVRIGGTLDAGETNPQFGELARKARNGVADGADRRRECHDFRELLRARPRDDARCGVVGVGGGVGSRAGVVRESLIATLVINSLSPMTSGLVEWSQETKWQISLSTQHPAHSNKTQAKVKARDKMTNGK